jgi:cellulose synthase/poly-beta-1,6-N-acetylglucosamine synthase-like glycosyltransferase
MTGDVLAVVVLVCLGYLLLTNLTYVALVAIAFVENGVRRRETATQDYDVLATSRFTIPVSVIVAAYDEEPAIVATVESLLALEYPEHEVIVVNDGSRDGTLDRLTEAFDLEPYEVFTRCVFQTAEVRTILRCAEHPNLIVVDKENGGKADALNAGLNVARFRYVCGVDADTVFDREALLKGMREIVEDPARIIGVTSHLTIAENPSVDVVLNASGRSTAARSWRTTPRLPEGAQQPSRLVAARLRSLCRCVPDWRRTSRRSAATPPASLEDIELTFRVHERFLREADYDPLSPDNVGH